MEPTKADPVRKRRRWFIVAIAALLVVSLVSWWHWPRGDERFVGKWRTLSDGGVWQLKQNGQAVFRPDAEELPIVYTTWVFKDDLLMIGRSPFAPHSAWKTWFIDQFNRVVPAHRIVDGQMCLRLDTIESSRLEGVQERWPDAPRADPGETKLGFTLWWDAKGTMKLGKKKYEFIRIE